MKLAKRKWKKKKWKMKKKKWKKLTSRVQVQAEVHQAERPKNFKKKKGISKKKGKWERKTTTYSNFQNPPSLKTEEPKKKERT
jgi:hypothetical protein